MTATVGMVVAFVVGFGLPCLVYVCWERAGARRRKTPARL